MLLGPREVKHLPYQCHWDLERSNIYPINVTGTKRVKTSTFSMTLGPGESKHLPYQCYWELERSNIYPINVTGTRRVKTSTLLMSLGPEEVKHIPFVQTTTITTTYHNASMKAPTKTLPEIVKVGQNRQNLSTDTVCAFSLANNHGHSNKHQTKQIHVNLLSLDI